MQVSIDRPTLSTLELGVAALSTQTPNERFQSAVAKSFISAIRTEFDADATKKLVFIDVQQ